MKKILITGGTGYVGGRLAKRLSGEHKVLVSSRNPQNIKNQNLYKEVEIIDHHSLFDSKKFPVVDAIIHLAALNEKDSVTKPSDAIRVNVDETRIILENSINRGVKRFIYFSTAHIYGAPLAGNINETTLPRPAHPYSITHRAAEDYIVAATDQKRIQGTVLRLSNSFGAPVSKDVNRWTLLANDLCRQAVEKGEMTLHSNGCQYRDFICLTDVEDVIAFMMERDAPLKYIVYNLGSGLSMRVIDMARLIGQLCITVLQKNIEIKMPADVKETEEPGLEFSTTRLMSEGFKINNDVHGELDRLLRFCAEQFQS
jgi:UDP-glucose 4-epimerase